MPLYNPVIPLLGMYLQKEKTQIQKDTYIPKFTAAVFTTAGTRKQRVSIHRGIEREKWYIDTTVEYYSAMKKNHAICSNTDRPRDDHTPWSQTDMLWYYLYVGSKK